MAIDLGDRYEDSVIDFSFETVDSSQAPIILAGSPVVSVYAGNSATQITSGVTLNVNHDSVTGYNHVRIDLSSHASYTPGQDYSAVITTGTVDSISVVGVVVATFSIENRDLVDKTVWWVDKTNGSDSNVGHTKGNSFETIGAAVTAASAGDTIRLAADTWDEDVNLPVGVRLIGMGVDGTGSTSLISRSSGGTPLTAADDCYIEGVYVVTTDTSSSAAGITCTGLTNVHIKNCRFVGEGAGIFGAMTINMVLENSRFEAARDGGYFQGAVSLRVINCKFSSTGSPSSADDAHGLSYVGLSSYFEGCTFASERTDNVANDSVAAIIAAESESTTFIACHFLATHTHASATGDVAAIRTTSTGKASIIGGSADTTQSGSGDDFHVDTVTGSQLGLMGLNFDTAKINGSDYTYIGEGFEDMINSEVDSALDTAIPGSPAADSINQRIRSMDLLTESGGVGDIEAVLDKVGTDGVVVASSGLDNVLIDGKTLPVAIQIIAASSAGKVSGAGTATEVFVGLDAATTRITATVDASGNRSAMIYS